MKINVINNGNYPQVEGAGLLGDIVNKEWSEEWVRSNWPQFKTFDQAALDVLIKDYNERHATTNEANKNGKGENL